MITNLINQLCIQLRIKVTSRVMLGFLELGMRAVYTREITDLRDIHK
jgi:hypothetical protein